jgi:hypothetical protein
MSIGAERAAVSTADTAVAATTEVAKRATTAVEEEMSAHYEAEIIAALASHQAHQAITTGIFGAQDRHRSIAMQRRQDEAIRAARAAMDEDNLNGG